MSASDQPINSVEWVDADSLHANGYNPNHVAAPEQKLLRLSLLEDGWTQPIVARPDGEIVDGFHRWTLASTDPAVSDLTAGKVPVVRLPEDPAGNRLATIRHNRARGQHAVMKMADLVNDLIEMGLDHDEIRTRLGMDDEEVQRLADRGDKMKRSATEEFGKAWKPAPTEQKD